MLSQHGASQCELRTIDVTQNRDTAAEVSSGTRDRPSRPSLWDSAPRVTTHVRSTVIRASYSALQHGAGAGCRSSTDWCCIAACNMPRLERAEVSRDVHADVVVLGALPLRRTTPLMRTMLCAPVLCPQQHP